MFFIVRNATTGRISRRTSARRKTAKSTPAEPDFAHNEGFCLVVSNGRSAARRAVNIFILHTLPSCDVPTYLGMEEIQLEMNGMSNNSSLCVCYFYRNFYKYKSRLVFVVARFWEKPCRNFGEIFDKTVPDGKRLS